MGNNKLTAPPPMHSHHKSSGGAHPPMTHHLFQEPRESQGLLLSHLLLATTGDSPHIKPSHHPALIRGNMKAVLDVWRSDPAISLNTLSADNLFAGDGTYVLAWIWQLIKRYDESAKGITRDEWVQQTMARRLVDEGKTELIGVEEVPDESEFEAEPLAQQVPAPPVIVKSEAPPAPMAQQVAAPPVTEEKEVKSPDEMDLERIWLLSPLAEQEPWKSCIQAKFGKGPDQVKAVRKQWEKDRGLDKSGGGFKLEKECFKEFAKALAANCE